MKLLILFVWLALSILPVCAMHINENGEHINDWGETDVNGPNPNTGALYSWPPPEQTYVLYDKSKHGGKGIDPYGVILNPPPVLNVDAKLLVPKVEKKPGRVRRMCDKVRRKLDAHPYLWKSTKFTGKVGLWGCQVYAAIK